MFADMVNIKMKSCWIRVGSKSNIRFLLKDRIGQIDTQIIRTCEIEAAVKLMQPLNKVCQGLLRAIRMGRVKEAS